MALLSTEKGENLRAVQVARGLTAEKDPSIEIAASTTGQGGS